MKEIINVTTKEQLKELYKCSAMTWEGLIEDDFQLALDECGQENAKGYLIKGAVMNRICHLYGRDAYPDDLNIFAIDKFKGLALMYGARWMDDIIDNNADRACYHPFNEHFLEE